MKGTVKGAPALVQVVDDPWACRRCDSAFESRRGAALVHEGPAHPQVGGKLPGSERGLPFGPYTITQIVGGGLTFVVLTNTTKVWGKFGFFGNLAVQAGVTLGVTLALRLVKSGGRDPLTAALALLALWVRPRFGRVVHPDPSPSAPAAGCSRLIAGRSSTPPTTPRAPP